MFDKKVFDKEFNKRLGQLGKAESSVRAELNVLSRTVLEAVHATEQIGYVNQLMAVLTPVNRKAAIVFFKHFAGFHYDEVTRMTKSPVCSLRKAKSATIKRIRMQWHSCKILITICSHGQNVILK